MTKDNETRRQGWGLRDNYKYTHNFSMETSWNDTLRWGSNYKMDMNSVAGVRERTIPTERLQLVGEVSVMWSAWRVPTAVFWGF
jgi:hypothetical protein